MYHYVNSKKNMKEGVPNDKLVLKKLLTYIKSVYKIPQKVKSLTDNRQRKSIPFFNLIMPVFLGMLLQYESFHAFFSSPEDMHQRLRHCIKGRIPKVDAVREGVSQVSVCELGAIHDSVIDKVYSDKVLRGGTIGGYVTAAIDGVELLCSTKKYSPDCLVRKNVSGQKESFIRSVVCCTVGDDPHLILGQEMLRPRDGAAKDEGELTGGKRLIRELYQKHHHFADVIVADALYLNAPFINTVLECHMDAVIRLKDETRNICKDAEGLFQAGEGSQPGFVRENGRVRIEAWDISDFHMDGISRPVRVLKYVERHRKGDKEEVRKMWVVTTLEQTEYQTIWKMMHKRWDIEENGFHQLKTYYHASHCFCLKGAEAVFLLMVLAFNMRELYLFRRLHHFREWKISRKSATKKFCDDLQMNDYRKLIYNDE